jgi:hypothetical protein
MMMTTDLGEMRRLDISLCDIVWGFDGLQRPIETFRHFVPFPSSSGSGWFWSLRRQRLGWAAGSAWKPTGSAQDMWPWIVTVLVGAFLAKSKNSSQMPMCQLSGMSGGLHTHCNYYGDKAM